jgi:hypothetical protein
MGWEERDRALRAQGFPPSKLGPGVPAVTYTPYFGGSPTMWDDTGHVMSEDELSEGGGRDDTGRRHWRDDDDDE